MLKDLEKNMQEVKPKYQISCIIGGMDAQMEVARVALLEVVRLDHGRSEPQKQYPPNGPTPRGQEEKDREVRSATRFVRRHLEKDGTRRFA